MKTKITLLIGAVALVTLSFTFASVDQPVQRTEAVAQGNFAAPVGGMIADEVVK